MVVGDLDQFPALPLGDEHHLFLAVDLLDPAPVKTGARNEFPDRIDDVIRIDGPGGHLGQKRLENEIVFLGQQLDTHVPPRMQPPGQVLRHCRSRETATEDHDPMQGLASLADRSGRSGDPVGLRW